MKISNQLSEDSGRTTGSEIFTMTRKTALKAFFALLASRAVAQQSITFDIEKLNENLTYHFAAKRLTIQIDGRSVTFTAKELADALEAK